MRHFKGNDEVVWRYVTEDLSQNKENICNSFSSYFQRCTPSSSSKVFIQSLKELQEAVFKEFHYSTDSLKHIEILAKECESSCEKMKSSYDKLTSKLKSLQVQQEESVCFSITIIHQLI